MATINLPTPGITPGPAWATSLNSAITAVNLDVENRAISEYPGGFLPGNYYGTTAPAVSTGAPTLNLAYATPIVVPKAVSIASIAVEVTTLLASSLLRLGIYDFASGTAHAPGNLLFDAGTISGATTGVKEITLSGKSFPLPGLYWLVCVAQTAAPTLRTITGNCPPVTTNSFAGANAYTAYTQASVTGALPAGWSGTTVATLAPRIMVKTA